MANRTTDLAADWQPRQVYVMAAVCLAVGLMLGYLFRGSESSQVAANATKPPVADPSGSQAPPPMPTLEEMKQMADKKAEPLLAQLKGRPNDAALLAQLADVYSATHQFKEAAIYYDRSLQIDPKNVGVRTRLASCLYFEGQVDNAISQLDQ